MLTDLRFALRQLVQSPGFTFTAVLSLALGIGANSAVFGLVNELLLRALPVREPQELVIFRVVESQDGLPVRSSDGYGGRDPVTGRYSITSFPLVAIDEFATQKDILSSVFGFSPFWQSNVLVNGAPDTAATAQLASGEYHRGLGVQAWVGRTFTAEDDRADAAPVAVISYRFWQRHFAGDPAAIGRTIQLNKVTLTIVGVTPEAFGGSGQAGEYYDVTVPLAHHLKFAPDMTERLHASTWWIRVMARLAPGATASQAEAALTPRFARIAREGWETAPRRPGERAERTPGDPILQAEPGFQGENDRRRDSLRPLQMMAGLVALVLLAAYANVANLLLARATARRREIAVRLALGASRIRVVRQLLSESLLLAAAAATGGLALAWASRSAIVALRPFNIDFAMPFDWRVLGFTAAAAVLTTLVFGLAPALRATKLDLVQEFQGGRAAVGTRSWLSRSLMVLQIALSLLLLVCTGLLIGSLRNLEQVDAGFNRGSLAAFRIDTGSAGYEPAASAALRARLQEQLAALPGVRGTTFSRVPVLSRSRHTSSITLPGFTPPPGVTMSVHVNHVAANFFPVLELPILLGRAFNDADISGSARIAVVNQTFVARFFGSANPIGQRFGFGPGGEVEIVGVARDAKYSDLRSEIPATIYLPFRADAPGASNFLVRTADDPARPFADIRATVRALDPTLPVVSLRTLDEQIDRLHAQERLFAKLGGAFGVLVLILSAIGLYGLMSYGVARRTSEIGVRMALGALPRHVLSLFLSESLLLVATGLLVGGLAAWGTGQLLKQMLFGLTTTDPLIYGLAALGLSAVATIAAVLPARRAAKLDPTVALRAE